MKSLAPRELQARLAAGDGHLVLLDVREPWEFEIGHLDGAINIPMANPEPSLADLDRAAETVVICHYGIRSREFTGHLERLGFTCVINLDGGIDAWSRQVDPALPTY
jgi:rhodanese-related sulfurtransferase